MEVTGRGKLGGKNQNYLNVKYSDGSEGGVYIDKHQWRIVRRKDLTLEDSPDHSVQPTLRQVSHGSLLGSPRATGVDLDFI